MPEREELPVLFTHNDPQIQDFQAFLTKKIPARILYHLNVPYCPPSPNLLLYERVVMSGSVKWVFTCGRLPSDRVCIPLLHLPPAACVGPQLPCATILGNAHFWISSASPYTLNWPWLFLTLCHASRLIVSHYPAFKSFMEIPCLASLLALQLWQVLWCILVPMWVSPVKSHPRMTSFCSEGVSHTMRCVILWVLCCVL